METILDHKAEKEHEIAYSDREVFTLIWSKPRSVLTYIRNVDYAKHFTLLVLLVGIHRALAQESNYFSSAPPVVRVVLLIVFGALLGWITYYIFAAVWSWVGSWFNGKGNHRSMYTCVIYAMLPAALSLIVIVPVKLIAAIDGFNAFSMPLITAIELFVTLVILVATVWSIVNVIIAISVVHQFSIQKAILTFIIPAAIFVLLGVTIGLLFALI